MRCRPGSPEWAAAARRRLRPALTGWHAGQACSGGSAGPEVPDASSGAGATLSSQQTGHSTCACACRPRSCSHTKYAAPATSSKPGPPPKGRPGTLGIRRSIAGHLPIGKTARTGVALAAGPFQCGTTMPICGGIIDAGASCGTPGNAEPDQTRSRRPVALNHRSRTVSRSESAVAPTAESVFLPESWRCVVAGDILTVLREAPLQYRRQIGRALTRTGEDHIHHVAERDRIRRADGTPPLYWAGMTPVDAVPVIWTCESGPESVAR